MCRAPDGEMIGELIVDWWWRVGQANWTKTEEMGGRDTTQTDDSYAGKDTGDTGGLLAHRAGHSHRCRRRCLAWVPSG
jgi:hypothetical protein